MLHCQYAQCTYSIVRVTTYERLSPGFKIRSLLWGLISPLLNIKNCYKHETVGDSWINEKLIWIFNNKTIKLLKTNSIKCLIWHAIDKTNSKDYLIFQIYRTPPPPTPVHGIVKSKLLLHVVVANITFTNVCSFYCKKLIYEAFRGKF